MIIYATKQTVERYKIKLVHQFMDETSRTAAMKIVSDVQGDRLLEWGAKLFYFEGRKCLQVVNFESKFTLFLIDIKVSDVDYLGDMMAHYMLALYEGDSDMQTALKKMFASSPYVCYEKLTDRSAISTLNKTQLDFLDDGYRIYDYIEDGVIQTVAMNKRMNFKWLLTLKVEGKTKYIYPAEMFRELVMQRFGQS